MARLVYSESIKEPLVTRDVDGRDIREGDTIRFSYGIPPTLVEAPVIERDGVLIALTPDHNPKECPVKSLRRNVGEFWRQ